MRSAIITNPTKRSVQSVIAALRLNPRRTKNREGLRLADTMLGTQREQARSCAHLREGRVLIGHQRSMFDVKTGSLAGC
jgi:hypothetical protein